MDSKFTHFAKFYEQGNPYWDRLILPLLLLTAVTPTDRPRSVRNRCVIEVLVAFFML